MVLVYTSDKIEEISFKEFQARYNFKLFKILGKSVRSEKYCRDIDVYVNKGIEYKEGEVSQERIIPFNPKDGEPGGLYCASLENVFRFVFCGDYIATVSIECATQIVVNPLSFKVDRMMITKIEHLRTFFNKNREVIPIAVGQQGSILRNLPRSELTKELLELIIESNPQDIRHIPDELLTDELALIAISKFTKRNEYSHASYRHIINKLSNTIVYLEVLKKDGSVLGCIPKEKITLEMCEVAVKASYYDGFTTNSALRYVPSQFTEHVIRDALPHSPTSLKYVPDEIKLANPDICLEMVEKNGYNLAYIPDQIKTDRMCEIAVKNNPNSSKFIPKELLTRDLCKIIVVHCRTFFQTIPEEFIDDDLLLCAIHGNPHVIRNIPQKYLTPDLRRLALTIDGTLLEYIKQNDQTEEDVWTAVKQTGEAIQFSHKKFRTRELYQEALKTCRTISWCVPRNFVTTEDLMRSAIDEYSRIYIVPKDSITIEFVEEYLNKYREISPYITLFDFLPESFIRKHALRLAKYGPFCSQKINEKIGNVKYE